MKNYVIGLDFGTLSGRALLVDAETGEETAEAVYEYPHGVMDDSLPDGTKLPPLWALQHPGDYIETLKHTVPELLKKSGVRSGQVKGIGIDFTACTVLPVDEKGVPLCFDPRFESEPHAYVKLWKHHAAQAEADIINDTAKKLGESWIERYGGKVSCEWAEPKIYQIYREKPEVYRAAHRFIEAGDYVSFLLTGKETHSAVFAGYKALWNKRDGYPSKAFFSALAPELEGLVGTKLSENVLPVSAAAGELDARGAQLTGLEVGTPVALPMIDAHAAMPALGIHGAGALMMVLGTSTCHIINSETERHVPGICGVAEDSVIPGYFTYEAGQACCGDHFDWFVKNCLPSEYRAEAEKRGISAHKLLREKAMRLKPGESGLLALDWWNGNRSTLVDSELSGMILGMTLGTKPEEIYRALIEATAYGTKAIIDAFTENGVSVNEIVAAGGIAVKDEMMMQIYADVTGREIKIAASAQSGAYGSALYAMAAAGLVSDISEAAKKYGKVRDTVYVPVKENTEIYASLYSEYKRLYEYFGHENGVMKRLKKLS